MPAACAGRVMPHIKQHISEQHISWSKAGAGPQLPPRLMPIHAISHPQKWLQRHAPAHLQITADLSSDAI